MRSSQQRGTCTLCGEVVSRASAHRHAGRCAPAHDVPNGTPQALVQLRATVPGLPAYWLDVEAKGDAKLEALDSFLRRIWLECCGHLSAFRIGATQYYSRGYELGGSVFGVFGGQRQASRRSPLRGRALRLRVRFRIDDRPSAQRDRRAHGKSRAASCTPARAEHAALLAVRNLWSTGNLGLCVLSVRRREPVRVLEAPTDARVRRR